MSPVSSGGWTAGVCRQGPPPREPHDQPRVSLTMRTTSTVTVTDRFSDNATEAMRNRVQRLRDAGTPHTAHGNTIAYTGPAGELVELTYTEGLPE